MSKKCLAIAKKAMVWTLAASMLVATPLTASAAGLRDVYSVSDGTDTWDKWGDDKTQTESNTGTVTTTDTNTSVLGENDAKIIGIVLDKTKINAEKGKKETLKATVVLDGEVDDEVRKALNNKIKWEVQESDGEPISSTNSVLSITVKAGNRTEATLNPKQGTKIGEDMRVVAMIDGKQKITYTDKETGEKVTKEFAGLAEPYEAVAEVFIKEYATKLEFASVPDQYETRTVNMADYLIKTPKTANDTITWSIAPGVRGGATINANTGVVTVKKYDKRNAANNYAVVTAVSEKGKRGVARFEIKPAVKADKVGIYLDSDETMDPAKPLKKYEELDFGSDNTTVNVKAVMFKKNADKKFVTDETITDKITWSSNKPAIVKVPSGETDSEEAVTLTALSAGKATITAKTSSGKKATLNVTVKATLNGLEIDDISGPLYSGQSVQMTAVKDPEQNKDTLKWSIEKVEKTDKNGTTKLVANPNASINNKGVLTIKNKVDESYPVIVRVTSKTKGGEGAVVDAKGYITAVSAPIVVKQSSVKTITVTEDGSKETLARVNADDKKDKKTNGVSALSVPKAKVYTAVTDPADQNVTLKWTASGNNKIVKLTDNGDGTARIEAVGKGKATITVSGITVKTNKSGKESASVIKASFKVDVKQPVKTVTLNKSLVVLNEKTKKVKGESVLQDQKVTFKATLGPKNVDKKEVITWSVNDTTKASIDSKGKLTIKAAEVGDEVEVTARVKSGAYAKATVKVLNKTDKVVIQDSTGKEFDKKKSIEIGIGLSEDDEVQMFPKIMLKGDPKAYDPGDNNTEEVTYSVNKKGIVTVDADGTIHAVKAGNVTITAKTTTNKKATLKVKVVEPKG